MKRHRLRGRRPSRRTFVGLLGLALVSVAFLSVGNGGASPRVASAASLTVWKAPHTTQDAQFFGKILSAYSKSHPGITAKYRVTPWGSWNETYTSAFASGSPPDIHYDVGLYFAKFAQSGQLVALNKQFPAQTAALAKLYDPSILALAKLNGNLYGIPFINAGISFVWNKKLFAQAGLNPNKPPKTWAQLAVYAKKLTDPSTGVYGYAMLDDSTGEMLSFYPPFLVDYTPGGKFMHTGKWVLNSPQAAKGLGVLVSMYQNGFMPKFGTFAGHDLDTAFLQGKIAMYLNYSDFFPPEAKIKKQYPNLSYGISSPPCGPANCLNFGDIGFWSIATKSKDITEAFNLAEALNTPAVNNGYAHLSGLFPARKGLNPFAGDPTQQAYQKTQTNYMLLPRLPFDYWSILSPQIELALTGTESPAQALNAAASQINNQLQLQPCLGTCVG